MFKLPNLNQQAVEHRRTDSLRVPFHFVVAEEQIDACAARINRLLADAVRLSKMPAI